VTSLSHNSVEDYFAAAQPQNGSWDQVGPSYLEVIKDDKVMASYDSWPGMLNFG